MFHFVGLRHVQHVTDAGLVFVANVKSKRGFVFQVTEYIVNNFYPELEMKII